jgi:hypothetical protein
MEAFLTTHKVSELCSILEDNSDHSAPCNTWLLSPSLHRAFRYGRVRILPGFNPQGEDNGNYQISLVIRSAYVMVPENTEPEVPLPTTYDWLAEQYRSIGEIKKRWW